MPLYQSGTYWNARYFEEVDYFDWYCQYEDISDSIQTILNKLSQIFKASAIQILDFGCGTSLLSRTLSQRHANVNILAIDGSKHCIEFMHYNQESNESNDSRLEYKQIAFEKISFNKKSVNRHKYHFIVDKGTADSLLCAINGFDKVQRIINQNIYHLLKPNAIYLFISHNPNRYKLFEPSKWAIQRTAIEIPYFKDNQIQHAKITNDIRKYLNENNRILVQYAPTTQVDDSQSYLLELQRREEEREREKEKERQREKEKKKAIKIVFNLEQKTAEQLLEERRQRRLEYEATLHAAKEESEKFRHEFRKKQRLKQEQLRKKEEEFKNRKLVINTDQILADLEKEKEKELKVNEESASESDGGYMTDSSEEDKKKEREKEEMIAKLIEEHDNPKQKQKKEKVIKKKKKKKKKKEKSSQPQKQKQYYDETLPIYQRFRSKYCLLTDVEATHEPYCCFDHENGMKHVQTTVNKYKELLRNQLYRDEPQTKLVSKTFYMYCATKLNV